ncbi:MAG TPA: cobalamin biosynthesis protein CobQ [Patescibacteria group bacterium]|nr:cobalamin biosynthesis protein CobQ [Patescibacteria group bacterium]
MKQNINIGWLYPELMSTYGDRGNIISLIKRCEWRNIPVNVINLNIGFNKKDLEKCDLLFMGGAQDRQQEIVAKDLEEKSAVLSKLISNGLPGLYICGAYQFLGKYYKDANGTTIKGLGIIDIYTENSDKKRLIGNIVIAPLLKDLKNSTFVGFENHGGRTYLGKKVLPFAKVISGFGNNGIDQTEGAIYKNSICSYLHGPILPKNPELCDYLINIALDKKYGKNIKLIKLNDDLEKNARKIIAQRLKVKV